MDLEITRVSSFANPELLKDPISKIEIIREIRDKYEFEINEENMFFTENPTKFGQYTINVKDFFNK